MKGAGRKCLAALLALALLASLAPAAMAAEPNAAIKANAEKDLRYLALDDENNGPNDLYYQQKIMNPVTEDSFVLWYSGKNTNYPISWASSDPELIRINDKTHMAELVRVPDEDAEVTLTATMAVPYAQNSQDTYDMTKELTVRVPCLATRAQLDCDALTITDPGDVRGNLPLVRQGKYGSTISWTSSNPAVVSDDSPESELYDGGVVTRPEPGQAPIPVTLTAEITNGGRTLARTFSLRVSPKPAPAAERDHYLFVCYAENYDWNQDNLTTEEIYFGLSDNGLQWKNINVYKASNGQQYTRPMLRSTVGDMGVRDPHIVRSPDGDKFYVLATDLHAIGNSLPEREGAEFKRSSFDCVNGNRDLVIWETNDLTDWGEPRLVQCNFASAGNTYAPEAVWDEAKQAYLVYWASKDNAELNADGTYKSSKVGKIYYCYTRDFNTFSRPTLWLASTDDAMKSAFPNVSGEYDVYDTTIHYDPSDGLYYRFGTRSRLYVQTSESLDGPWSDAIALPGAINNGGVEAPTCYQLPDGTWMLLGDNYRQYVPYQAAHLSDFVKGSYKSMSFTYASNGPRYKHGTILPITEQEYRALTTEYDETLPRQEAPADGEGVHIDYAAVTFAVEDGFEARADSPTGPALTGGSAEPWMGRTIFVRRAAGDGRRASDWTAAVIPEPPMAPPTAPVICRSVNGLEILNTDALAGCEFSIGQGWNDTGVFDGLTPETVFFVQIRTSATENSFASGAATYMTFTCAADGSCALLPGEAVRVGDTLITRSEDIVTATQGSKKLEIELPAGARFDIDGEGVVQLPPGTVVDGKSLPAGGACDLGALSLGPGFTFDDVKDEAAFYYKPVYWAYGAEPQITNGLDDTHFGPDRGCTRGQVVTFLWRAAGCPEPNNTKTAFTDLKDGGFYLKAVAWAVENQITNGMTSTTFAPDATCTRAQIVTFLWRAQGSPEPAAKEKPFVDVSGGYYAKAVAWAVEQGVTKGLDQTHFGPDKTCTRGQIVTFLYRAQQE